MGWILILAGVVLLGVIVVVYVWTDYQDMVDNWIVHSDDTDDI